jgi:mono/diheme cytochrome c family protein
MESTLFKGIVTGVVLTLAAGLIEAWALVGSGYIPANADSEPSALEVWMAHTSLSATMNRLASKGPSPVTLTDAHLEDGVNLFARNCAVCHGSCGGDAAASLTDTEIWTLALFLKHLDQLPPTAQQVWQQMPAWPSPHAMAPQ